ncbi:acid-sensing ion channel 2-like [Acanthaster planci]|uniref:Acid-sensing ion channel 2-like n=1 Tax=Acanthaster planci TaxID=133434 RepID=A0A8B7Y0V8_ACAPL|nr:acid-sensing ion channel 2-like [Acanthaster planci]
MKDSSSQKQSDLDQEFASTTTLHGIARIFDSTRLPVRLLWLSILLGCLGVCVWQITDRFQRYLLHEATTAVSVEYVGDLDFPAVTICNFNRYRSSALTEDDKAHLEELIEYADYDYDTYDDEEPDARRTAQSQGETTNFSFSEVTLRTGFQMDEETLLDCKWRGKKNSCNGQNFTHVFTSFGNCWTFNSGETQDEKEISVLNQIQPGSGNGLTMVINIQQAEYTEPVQNGNLEAGLKVLVHDQETPPSVDSEGFAIAPGVHAFVGLRKIEYENLEYPWGECDKSRRLLHYDKYTLPGCDIECRAERIYERCQCKLVRHPGDETECSPLQVKKCATPVLAKLKTGEVEGCGCPVPCNYSEFRTSLSMATLPSNNLLVDLWKLYGGDDSVNYTFDETLRYIRDNWIFLDVYYESLNFEKYVQSEAITLSALISDIGGQMGLFLGASFITITEILHYLGRKAGLWVTSRSRPHANQSKVRPGNETVAISDLSSPH